MHASLGSLFELLNKCAQWHVKTSVISLRFHAQQVTGEHCQQWQTTKSLALFLGSISPCMNKKKNPNYKQQKTWISLGTRLASHDSCGQIAVYLLTIFSQSSLLELQGEQACKQLTSSYRHCMYYFKSALGYNLILHIMVTTNGSSCLLMFKPWSYS